MRPVHFRSTEHKDSQNARTVEIVLIEIIIELIFYYIQPVYTIKSVSKVYYVLTLYSRLKKSALSELALSLTRLRVGGDFQKRDCTRTKLGAVMKKKGHSF